MKTLIHHFTFLFSNLLLFLILFNQPGLTMEYKDSKIPAGSTINWYRINGSNTIIPIFEMSTTYYSVSRGFEIPLEKTSSGYKWAVAPSSMEGTYIGYDITSSSYYIAVKDTQASNFTDGKYGIGDKQYMTKIDEPKGIFKATTQAPKTIDDFLGIYQSIWLPGLRFEIRKENYKYFYDLQHMDHNSWKPDNKSQEITPTTGTLGFTGFERNNKQSLIYNEELHRYEMVDKDMRRQPTIIRMPLLKNSPSISTNEEAIPSSKLRFGITSWN